MGDTASRLRDEEEGYWMTQVKVTVPRSTPISEDPRFDLYFSAAITGVLAHRSSHKHSDKELIDQAYDFAYGAVLKRRGQ